MPVIGGYTCVEHGELLPVPGKPIVVGLPGHPKPKFPLSNGLGEP